MQSLLFLQIGSCMNAGFLQHHGYKIEDRNENEIKITNFII